MCIRDRLYGVLECKISEPLTEEEIKVLKEYWTGQMSDGWGEGFEQRPINVEDGEIYVSFWNSANFCHLEMCIRDRNVWWWKEFPIMW